VTVHYGDVPENLEQVLGQGVLYQASANQFLLKMDDIAHYLIQNGNEIIVQPQANSISSDIRVFLLGSGIGALLHQRGLLVLHAAALYTELGAVLFCGVSGSGKSTLLGEFLRRGYSMMVDDVCAIVVDLQKNLTVLPGYPRTRLWLDSVKKLDQNIEQMVRTRAKMEKYERQVPDQYWDQTTNLRKIYLLTEHNQDEIILEKIPRIHTFNLVLRNTYRHQFLDGLNMRGSHFESVTAVAQQIQVTRIQRPRHGFQLTELADNIEQNLA
jgi:hypothetical protein